CARLKDSMLRYHAGSLTHSSPRFMTSSPEVSVPIRARSQRRRGLVGVIVAMAIVNLVYGITFPLLALVLDSQGVSKTLIGLSTVSQALAILAIAPFAPGLLHRFEPARIMQTVTVVVALLLLVAGSFPNVWLWFPLRFLIGAFNAMLWIASEALINDMVEERNRGRVIGVYSSAGAAGFALGPLLLILTGSEGLLPFVATSSLVLAASVPLFFAHGHRMAAPDGSAEGVWKLFLLAPVIMLANITYASAAESMITFFPLFGLHLGISEAFALFLLTMVGVGSMILILPLGWLADKVNRMGLLVACVVLTMLGLLAMPYVLHSEGLATVFFFLFGGVEGTIYALGVILVGERFKGQQLAGASTAFTACWAVGTIAGPMLSGIGMDLFGADTLPLVIFVFFLLYLPLPLRDWLAQRRRSALED
ncbi:MAG TPA: MFS transporter, partial [Xanthomonadales bacterium]|nr:MFS transporter [Xanthomonadales bacterium]